MLAMKPACACVVSLLVALAGCKGDPKPVVTEAAAPSSSAAPAASASAQAEPQRPKRATHPAPKPEAVTLTADGVKLVGSLYAGGPAKAPAVILAHRMAGNRSEWIPLIERILPAATPMNVLAIDLRGHGGSVETAAKGKKLSWNEFKTEEFAAMAGDVAAAIGWMDHRAGGPPSALVLVGSDIGATAVVLAAKGLAPRLRGVALLSPGASLRGVDIYKPYGEVLALPNLVVGSMEDNASAEPVHALGAMAKRSKVLRVAGSLHSAEYMGRDHPEVWDELADWVEARVSSAPEPAASGSGQPPAAASAPR
jgi:pimeloyl-ACP methyl ester carboxylesterase